MSELRYSTRLGRCTILGLAVIAATACGPTERKFVRTSEEEPLSASADDAPSTVQGDPEVESVKPLPASGEGNTSTPTSSNGMGSNDAMASATPLATPGEQPGSNGESPVASSEGQEAATNAPEAPTLDGEASASHTNLTWLWDAPTGATAFLVLAPGATEATRVESATTRFDTEVAGAGSYTVRVASCGADDACSSFAEFTTVVEQFGESYSSPWRGVERDITRSAMGNYVGVACHNCYNGPGNEILDAQAVTDKITRAITNGADEIEVDVAEFGGVLYASHDDPTAAARPTLESILSESALATSNSLLSLEIKESSMLPTEFARRLLDVLDSHRQFARNGRPLRIRAFAGSVGYLTALRDQLTAHPLIAHYVRFGVLFQDVPSVSQFYADIDSLVVANGFDAVEIEYRSSNMLAPLAYARSLGLMAGVWTIPASFGEVYVANLRDVVDQMTLEYRVDAARALISDRTAAGFFDASVAAGNTLRVRADTGAETADRSIDLGLAAAGTTPHGTPTLRLGTRQEAASLFGTFLTFDSSQSQAIELFGTNARADEGFLVSAAVRFDDLDLSDNAESTAAIVNKSQSSGFALELFYSATAGAFPGETVLRFGVNLGDGFIYHVYPVGGSTGTGFTQPLNEDDAYIVSGAFDGNGGIYVFINNQRSPVAQPSANGTIAAGAVNSFAGADPQGGGTSRFYFDGSIQHASIQLWGDHTLGGGAAN